MPIKGGLYKKMKKTKRTKKATFAKVITLLLVFATLLTMFAGCTKATAQKTPEEMFEYEKEKVSQVKTQNFYSFSEYMKNVILKDFVEVKDMFIKISNKDATMTVHVLTSQNEYRVYNVLSTQIVAIEEAILSESKYIYLFSHNENGEQIRHQSNFNEKIWKAFYNVDGDSIRFEL